MEPRHPIYIISKGRAESRLTSKALDKIGTAYHIVIEPQEYDDYAAVVDPAKILVLPFSNLGLGSIPARNWVWEHSIAAGAARHWIMDDNIRCFYRLNRNRKIPIGDGTVFRVAEDFIERFENVAKAGFNYEMFVKRKSTWPPFYLNTRVYSCILLDNARYDEFPWRGRYNEDTDLSLRLLKAGYCTILFNAFLADKIGTMRMKGGNTDELYVDDGRLQMAQSLVDQHPDIARVSFKWNRPQHHVDYRPFKYNRLLLRKGLVLPTGTNNYGMRLEECVDGEWREMETD